MHFCDLMRGTIMFCGVTYMKKKEHSGGTLQSCPTLYKFGGLSSSSTTITRRRRRGHRLIKYENFRARQISQPSERKSQHSRSFSLRVLITPPALRKMLDFASDSPFWAHRKPVPTLANIQKTIHLLSWQC